ncbi:disulfide bond formation protein DsbA [Spongiactinospora sp. TRM90649]|uniref:mycothiol-dependent nitroreductase Rv2466c family protein n=1 Tax=Spongiactinospora sp. TRM90649 TaxID=3031114 RepID=UPI003211C95F
MSLSVLNENKNENLTAERRARLAGGMAPVRVLAAAAARYGEAVLAPLYTEIGTRLHNQGGLKDRSQVPAILRDSLTAAGFDPVLTEAAGSTEFDAEIRRSHGEGIGLVGEEVGTPVIAVGTGGDGDRIAFFGPVVTPAPKGEAAGRLWDGLLLVAGTDGFFEVKRTRTRRPTFD